MRYKLNAVLAVLLAVFMLLGASVAAEEAPKDVKEAPADDLTLTDEEKDDGWESYPELGFKFRFPDAWNEQLDYLDYYQDGDDRNEDAPLFGGVIFVFFSAEQQAKFDEIKNDKSLSDDERYKKWDEEVWSKQLPIGAVGLYRASAVKDLEKLDEVTGYPNNKLLSKDDRFLHIVSWADSDSEAVAEEDKKYYDEFFKTWPDFMESIVVAKPVLIEDTIGKLKNWTFKTVDLEGNEVDQSVFGEADLTMVNIWATWCGPCKRELPDLGKLAKEYLKDKGVQLVGIVSDVMSEDTDEDDLDLAKAILEDANAEYLNLRFDEATMQESVMKYITGIPTTFFVDKDGSVVGSVIVGSLEYDDFTAEVDQHLAALNGEKPEEEAPAEETKETEESKDAEESKESEETKESEEKAEEGDKAEKTEAPAADIITDIPVVELSVTDEEHDEGWRALIYNGFKYQIPKYWLDNSDYLDNFGDGDDADETNPLFGGRFFNFYPVYQQDKLDEIFGDKSLSDEEKYAAADEEVWSKQPLMSAMCVYRTPLVKDKELEEVTGYPNNKLIAQDDTYTFIFSWGNLVEDPEMTEDEVKIYKEMMDCIPAMMESVEVARPVKIDETIGAIKNWTFKSKDLEGNDVDESVFKDAELTMVNVWGTWCSPCKGELPDIAKVADKEFKDMGIQVLGIVEDVATVDTDEDDLDLAKAILEDAGCQYKNILFDEETMQESLFKYITGIPTTFFVDKEGNVVGSVIVGSMSAEDFIKEAEEHLQSVK